MKNKEEKRTIVMLSAKRCGSTAIFRMFQKHPDVSVCHINQEINNWEPNFWNLGAKAILGSPSSFISRFEKSHPFLIMPKKFNEQILFKLWDDILSELGPVLFDKSPQYLGNNYAIYLLEKYRDLGNDVRIFAMIRDPRDAITSQFELWRSYVPGDSPKKREIDWLKKYSNLEKIKRRLKNVPVFKYEEFCQNPLIHVRKLLDYCDISEAREVYSHIKPTSIGRYSGSINPRIVTWRFSQEFLNHLKFYGYPVPQKISEKRIKIILKMFKSNIDREKFSIKRKFQ
jgi:hypothetical protein|tara:strand:+ start:91 stop:945 length:855 start_codon:yes stop_codon:yes gene_type:complete